MFNDKTEKEKQRDRQERSKIQSVKRKNILYVRFSLIPMTSLEQKRLINKNSLKILNDPKGQWMITYRRYTNNRWDQLFRFIIQTEVKELWLSYNMQQTIIREISLVRFPCLIKLFAWENNICSLEPIQLLDAPFLQEINIEKNEICYLKPLKKILSNKLSELNLSRNPIRKISSLQQTGFDKELKGIFTEEREEPIIVNDLAGFIRFSNDTFKQLKVISMHRIRQPKVEAMLLERYPGMDLKVRQLGLNYYQNHMIQKVIDTPRLQKQTIYLRQKGSVTF